MNYRNLASNLKPYVIGGEYLVQIRPQFDKEDKKVIVASSRHVLEFDSTSCNQVNRINPSFENDDDNHDNIRIVACERIDNSLYIFTTNGRFLVWNLTTQDWSNELTLPLEDNEELISCKVLSKRQYIYTIKDVTSQKTNIYYSMSRSERERPKHREELGNCESGELNTFDIGTLIEEIEITSSQESKSKKDKLSKQKILAFINNSFLNFQRVAINEKLIVDKSSVKISDDLSFTCVRANSRRSMIAAGDTLGRIYLYTGNFCEGSKPNRTKLHWHSMPVNDLSFSSTGNTLFSVGGESGCVVVWDLTQNNIGKKRVIARLGMPIRHVNCGNSLNQLILSFEDNEIQIMDTNDKTRKLKTLTRRTIDIYRENNYKALRIDNIQEQKNFLHERHKSIGLLWHSKSDTIVTNSRTGWLQFYSPRERTRIQSLNFLKSPVLSLEKEARVIPSDITRATITNDGNWLALYETRESDLSFSDIKLHIWQRSSVTGRWIWIQTADRLHSSTVITDLRFSPDGQFLISVSEDGTFHILHRVYFDSKQVDAQSRSKQMYAKGFAGNVPPKLSSTTTFSQDSSVLAMSLKNDTTLIWMIVDPYKLVYECQLNQIVNGIEPSTNGELMNLSNSIPSNDVLGLHFGNHKANQGLAPLCEVRTNNIKLWNILNPNETMEYPAKEIGENEEFTSVAFDQCPVEDDRNVDHFAVSTKNCLILIFKLQITRTTLTTTSYLQPLITINCSLPFSISGLPLYYTHMCFLGKPILEMDKQCDQDSRMVELLNRLCLMTSYQELVAISDKLTLERQTANTSCNRIKSFDMTELQAYFAKSMSNYNAETSDANSSPIKIDPKLMTEKQKKIRNRLEVQKMIKDLLIRVPSQNLPNMETLGPMILDKLI